MKAAVIGTDRRFACLAGLLRAGGCEVVRDAEAADVIITRWPPSVDLPPGARVVTCGPLRADGGAMDLLEDEIYQTEIARMTAEGAVAAAIAAAAASVCGTECLIVGWGRIGKALAELLLCMGARVTVLTRREEVFPEIGEAGARAAHMRDAASEIEGRRMVFSTPPWHSLGREELSHADKNAVVIDLASPPYGVDLTAAMDLGVRAWREPGLPGRYCPENAASAIYAAMVRGGVLDG